MVLYIETLYCNRDFLYRSRASLIKYMDADTACFWLLPLVRHKNNNEVNGSQLSVLHFYVIDFLAHLWGAYAIPVALSGVRRPSFVVRRPSSVVRRVSSVSTITTRNN